MLRRAGERGVALLLVLAALLVVDALLAAALLWSRAESREAAEALAASRAEWGAASGLALAAGWLAARTGPLAADTALAPAAMAGSGRVEVAVERHGPDLVRVRSAAAAGPAEAPLAGRARCRWYRLGAPDSSGTRRYAPWGGPASAC